MNMTSKPPTRSPRRDLYFMINPALWPTWPFLPLIRRTMTDEIEVGLLCDVERLFNLTGFRCTIFLSNIFALPATLEEFMSLPRQVLDTFEEVIEAGWRVD